MGGQAWVPTQSSILFNIFILEVQATSSLTLAPSSIPLSKLPSFRWHHMSSPLPLSYFHAGPGHCTLLSGQLFQPLRQVSTTLSNSALREAAKNITLFMLPPCLQTLLSPYLFTKPCLEKPLLTFPIHPGYFLPVTWASPPEFQRCLANSTGRSLTNKVKWSTPSTSKPSQPSQYPGFPLLVLVTATDGNYLL